jgi:hypothetical protein
MIDNYKYEERIAIIQYDGGLNEQDAIELANREFFPKRIIKPTSKGIAAFNALGWSASKGIRFVNRNR